MVVMFLVVPKRLVRAQNEGSCVQATVLALDLIERGNKSAVRQVLDTRWPVQKRCQFLPSTDLAEGPKGDDLKGAVSGTAGVLGVADVPDHILRDSISRTVHVAEFKLLQDGIVGPRRAFARETTFERSLPSRGEPPIQLVNAAPRLRLLACLDDYH